jgi:hypothetical protein
MRQQINDSESKFVRLAVIAILLCLWLLAVPSLSVAQPAEDQRTEDTGAPSAVFAIEAIEDPPTASAVVDDKDEPSQSTDPTKATDQSEGADLTTKGQQKLGQPVAQEGDPLDRDMSPKEQVSESSVGANTDNPSASLSNSSKSEQPVSPTFIEGELVSVGQIGLLPWDNRFGAQIGIERLGEIYYGALNVGINHRFNVKGEPLRLTVGVPLRFELLDARPNQRFDHLGRFRQQDWDEASDFAKVIQRLQYGSKEQRFFLDINRFSAHNLGHGLIMKRYDANLNLNTSRVGVQLDAFSDYIGFESMLNDITNPNLVGALVFIKPLSLVDRSSYLLRSFSLGVSVVTDLRAPVRNALDRDDFDNDGRRETELQVDQKTFQPDSLTSFVTGYGIDVELKLVDKREFDYKTYVDISSLRAGLPTGDPISIEEDIVGSREVISSGWAWGHLIRSNLGIDPIHALRIRLEYRNFDPNYLPSYFDSLYEIQRFQYSPGGAVDDLANATKLQRVFGRDPEGSRVHGGYFETSWRVGDGFAFAFGLEVNNQTPDNHGFIHLELPKVGKFQLSTTYHRRNAQNRKELFQAEFGDNDIWILQTRFRTFSWLYNNLSVMTPFGFGPDSVFRSAIQVNLSLEVGFSYGDEQLDRPKDQNPQTMINPATPPEALPPPKREMTPASESQATSDTKTVAGEKAAENEPSAEDTSANSATAAEESAAESEPATEESATEVDRETSLEEETSSKSDLTQERKPNEESVQ